MTGFFFAPAILDGKLETWKTLSPLRQCMQKMDKFKNYTYQTEVTLVKI